MTHKPRGLRTSVYQVRGNPSTREGFRSQSSRRVQDENKANSFACEAIAIIIIFRKQEVHDSINRESIGIAQAFAEAYTGFFKAAYEPCLFVNLSDKRTPESRQQVIDLFSQRLQSALAQDPAKYSCRWRLQLMLISKRPE